MEVKFLTIFSNADKKADDVFEYHMSYKQMSFRGTLTSFDGFMIGSPSSESFLVPQLSNQGSPTHSASMCMTEDCVTMFSILSPPTSTTGRLFILYLERSSSMVRNVSEVCSARNGAQRKLPEISPTYRGTT